MLEFSADDNQTVDIPYGYSFLVQARGDFGGGTLSVQTADDSAASSFTTYQSGLGGQFTAEGERGFMNTGESYKVNFNLSGSSSPTLTVTVHLLER